MWWSSADYRRRLRANLSLAVRQPDRRLLHGVISQSGQQMLELPFIWMRPLPEVLSRIVRVEGRELIEQGRADGYSLMLLTPHLGCFEICAHYGASLAPSTILYRAPRKKLLRPLVEMGRTRGTLRVTSADVKGVRQLVKALRKGEMVGMLPDQAPQEGEGMWTPFFGRPAWTMTLAARLSEVKKVKVLMIWAERLAGGGGYVLRISEPAEPIDGPLEARCAALNREIERLVLECPSQYLWGYNRYKRPKGVPPPPQET